MAASLSSAALRRADGVLIRRLRRKYMAPILPEVRPPKKAVSLHYTRFAPAGHCIDSGSAAQRAEKSLFSGRVEKVGLGAAHNQCGHREGERSDPFFPPPPERPE